MKRAATIALLSLASLTLTSCERGIDIQIAGAPFEPEFLVAGFDNGLFRGPQPGIDNVDVGQARGGQNRALWSIDRDPSCAPTSRFHYGAAPDGWSTRVKGRPLEAGVTYVVSMSGCGFIGGRVFKILRGKIVSADGFGDQPIETISAMK